MWWPIRNQILMPFVTILVAAVTVIAVATARQAMRRSEQQTIGQLRKVVDTLGRSNFPFTEAVLVQMRGLSGAHFVACDADRHVVASTLSFDLQIPATLFETPRTEQLDSIALHPRLALGNTRYLLAMTPTPTRDHVVFLLVLYPEQSWRQAQWDAAIPPLLVGAAALGLTVVVAMWLASRLGSRIRSVEQRVATIAAGEFRKVELHGYNDEVRRLSASVNVLCNQLEQMHSAVRQSERVRLLGQLAGGLAHHLRNAVTGARMALQIHQQRCQTSAADQSVAVALRQLTVTEEKVKDLLSVGRNQQLKRQMCNIDALIREVADLIAPACQHARVRFEHTNIADCHTVHADPDRLRTAVLNLVLNAIEAVGVGGSVAMKTSMEHARLRIDVSDTGPGPPPEIEQRLFEPFITAKPEGVGLGLALAKQCATDHGGNLTWQRDGQWTRFSLEIPLDGERSVGEFSHSPSAAPCSSMARPKASLQDINT